MTSRMLIGAVVIRDDDDLQAMTSLLFHNIRSYVTPLLFNKASEITPDLHIDFITVNQVASIEECVRFFQSNQRHVPFIIHLAHPDIIPALKAYNPFHGIQLVHIPQANLDQQDVTLNFEAFVAAIESLRDPAEV